MARVTYDFSGTVALVTGAASGIGLATARKVAQAGGVVAVNDVPGPKLDAAVARLTDAGMNCFAAPADVGDAAAVSAMVAGVVERAGRLDYLVNNAATPGTRVPIPPGDFARMDEAFWQRLVNINQIGPYRCTAAAAPFLQAQGGAIVNVASTAGLGRGGSSSVYASTKAALILLTKEWAFALGPSVRVNAIAPNVVVGSGWEVEFPPEEVEQTGRSFPLRRPGTPDDYADVILWFLAGAGYVTGQTLVVDGGGARD
jgi:3-oxoacyl-[acyl-carrier protein] reductase